MATTMQPLGIPSSAEDHSPTPSSGGNDSLTAADSGEAHNGDDRLHLARRRAQRSSPSRMPLRTNFRTFSGVASVVVGEADNKQRPEVRYLIHKELLTSASPFFAAALNGTFAEGMDQVVRLPGEKAEIFEWFLQWLYTGTLKTPTTAARCNHYMNTHTPNGNGSGNGGGMMTPTVSPPSMHSLTELTEYDIRTDGDLRNAQGSPKYFLLLDLYALSDRLLTTPLSNHILSTIARLSESTNSVPTPSDTWILYDTIRDNCAVRALVLDLFAYKKTDRLLETHKDEWHPKFLRELCVKLKRPGPEAIERHSLVAWRPTNWNATKACELCKVVLQPGISGDKCCACEKVFCSACLRNEGKGVLPNDTSGCKPWAGRGMCLRYHEHADGESCG